MNDQQKLLSEKQYAVTPGDPFGPELSFWDEGRIVIGVDEAGRGPLAGPVTAGAVAFSKNVSILGITDSKAVRPALRKTLALEIMEKAMACAVEHCDAERIDEINILQATREAMRRAVQKVVEETGVENPVVLVDGRIPPLCIGQQINIIKGDRLSFSIGAASILAKVARDRMMEAYAEKYPEYGFERHKGYPTKLHVETLAKYGPCEIHRRSFHVKGWRLKDQS